MKDAREKMSPIRRKWLTIMEGLILEFADDGFDPPEEVKDAMWSLMRFAAQDIERKEAAETFPDIPPFLGACHLPAMIRAAQEKTNG